MKNYCFNSNIYIYQKEAKWKAAEINTIRKVIKVTKIQRNGLTIRLSNDKDVKVFNLKWKGINKATNILSFFNNDQVFHFENNITYLGDIIISYDTLLREVKKSGAVSINVPSRSNRKSFILARGFFCMNFIVNA